jgi:serpin B
MTKPIHFALVFVLLVLSACAPTPTEPGPAPDNGDPAPVPSPTPIGEDPMPEPYPSPTHQEPAPDPYPTPIDDETTPETPSVRPPVGDIQLVSSNVARQESPQVDQGELGELVRGNNQFAFDLYGTIRDQDGNLFFSPYSISLALAMTYAGAGGDTEGQMAEALNFNLPQERLHPAFNALDQALDARGVALEGEDNFRLNIVNSLWGQQDYRFLPEYLDLLALNYGAGLQLLDFQTRPEPSRQIINDWVSEQTEERIEDLLPPGVIDELTRLVLVNAIYFNATWASQFNESATREATFDLLDGSEVRVPMMNQEAYFGYFSAEDFQVIELPYQGWELSMVILLPDEDEFERIESGLTAEMLGDVLARLQNTNLDLSMPKFTYESEFQLSQALSQLGMIEAFEGNQADFSGMDGTRELYIKEVLHKAFVAVDEEGTEAAAATAVVAGVTSMPPPPLRVSVDRPFIYLIRDIETNTILFLGRVLNPGS